MNGNASRGPLEIVVAIAPDDADSQPFQRLFERLGDRVQARFVDRSQLASSIASAEVVVSQALTDEELGRAESLRWLSSWAAGLDKVARPSLVERGIQITSASGVHGPNIAEQVMAMMLMFTRQMHVLHRAQIDRRWARPKEASRAVGADELTGKTLLIVGLGRIGEALALRAKSFGMHVVGVKRDSATRHDGDIEVDELVSFEELDGALKRADHVCIALPLTHATQHLFDARRLGLLKPTAYLYNIARGPIIDEVALADALSKKSFAGAGLDVFEEEPLPASSPLWDLHNVILTPHTAGFTPYYFERAAALFADNLNRYLEGTPLRNSFDPKRGY